jgi:hypothetical protein
MSLGFSVVQVQVRERTTQPAEGVMPYQVSSAAMGPMMAATDVSE